MPDKRVIIASFLFADTPENRQKVAEAGTDAMAAWSQTDVKQADAVELQELLLNTVAPVAIKKFKDKAK
jgi:hypothetical protein